MHRYEISAGTPEGTDWAIRVDHEKAFTDKEFRDLAEEALVYAFEKGMKNKGLVFTSMVDTDYICEFLFSKGFIEPQELTASYDLEPYWNKGAIRSRKLLDWINRREITHKPGYLMEDAHD